MLVALKDEELEKAGIKFKAKTLRHWRYQRKNMQLFRKIGGKVFLETKEWEKLIKQAEKNARKEAL